MSENTTRLSFDFRNPDSVSMDDVKVLPYMDHRLLLPRLAFRGWLIWTALGRSLILR